MQRKKVREDISHGSQRHETDIGLTTCSVQLVQLLTCGIDECDSWSRLASCYLLSTPGSVGAWSRQLTPATTIGPQLSMHINNSVTPLHSARPQSALTDSRRLYVLQHLTLERILPSSSTCVDCFLISSASSCSLSVRRQLHYFDLLRTCCITLSNLLYEYDSQLALQLTNVVEIFYCPQAEATAVLFSVSSLSFFSVNTITHEPRNLAWLNFARTCTLTSLEAY